MKNTREIMVNEVGCNEDTISQEELETYIVRIMVKQPKENDHSFSAFQDSFLFKTSNTRSLMNYTMSG